MCHSAGCSDGLNTPRTCWMTPLTIGSTILFEVSLHPRARQRRGDCQRRKRGRKPRCLLQLICCYRCSPAYSISINMLAAHLRTCSGDSFGSRMVFVRRVAKWGLSHPGRGMQHLFCADRATAPWGDFTQLWSVLPRSAPHVHPGSSTTYWQMRSGVVQLLYTQTLCLRPVGLKPAPQASFLPDEPHARVSRWTVDCAPSATGSHPSVSAFGFGRRNTPLETDMKSSVLAFFAFLAVAGARTLTVSNNCPFTIWPAIFTDLNAGSAVPNFPTGWEAGAFTRVTFDVPDNWKSGRIWGRRDCDFSDPNPAAQCADGGCNGGLECDPHTGTGVPPATLAEFTFQGGGFKDFYDVSLVDGFNLPINITNDVGCGVPDCPVDLNPNCPAPLRLDPGSSNAGCKSACVANLDGNQADSPNCCSGSHSTPATCPSAGVQYYSYFKGNCPHAYAYPYDESSGVLFTCDSNLHADYTVTFCP